MKVSFTGHRPDKIQSPQKLKDKLLKALLAQLGDLNAHTYVVGGCPGFDTIALELLLEQKVPKEQILLAVPFRGFEKFAGFRHEKENLATYHFNYTCGVSVKEVGGSTGSFGQKCNIRNAYLVDNCEVMFTNWDGSNGGTANTVKMAKKKKVVIHNIVEA